MKDYATAGLGHDAPKKHQHPVRAKHGIKHIHITNTDDGGHHIAHTKDDGTEIHHVAPDVAGLQQNLGQMLAGPQAGAAEPQLPEAPAEAA